MEKFRIAQYGFIQMVALAYGILASGLIVKAAKYFADTGLELPTGLRIILYFHDYGIFLALIIIGWAIFCAFHASIFSVRYVDENTIVVSGLILSGIFFILGVSLTCIGIDALFSTRQ